MRQLVLCYHSVSDAWDNEAAVRPTELRAQLSALVGRGYRSVTFTEAVTRPVSGLQLCITFDDAFMAVHRLALPILRDLGLIATVFVPTAYVPEQRELRWDGYRHLDPPPGELQSMSWDELRDLVDAGWEIGSHSRTHPHLTAVDDAALRDELSGSREECEQALGLPCRSIAYPYGDVDRRVRAATAAAGYAAGAALGYRWQRSDPLTRPRVAVYRDDDERRFSVKSSRVLGTRPAAAALAAARTVHQRLPQRSST